MPDKTDDVIPAELARALADKWWRMNNLYTIITDSGEQLPFRCNPVQARLYKDLHYKNLILKARQLGCTTFIDLFIFDECLWNQNTEAAITADTRQHAEDIFRRKILFPYKNLPESLRGGIVELQPEEGTKGSTGQLKLKNNSVISVGTSARSGTLMLCHVSELGRISAKRPDISREIITGTLPAVKAQHGLVFIESTAMGHGGDFYEMCQRAMNLQKAIKAGTGELTPLDYKFHFFPWWEDPSYVLDGRPLGLSAADVEYFKRVEEMARLELGVDIKLSDAQKRWYLKKREEQGEYMKSEMPSYPEEAFEQSIEGAYFARQMHQARVDGRICEVPHESGYLVDTWWDLGMDDYMSAWFTQDVGREIRVIDYWEGSDEGLPGARRVLDERGYRYGRFVGPHDISVREVGTGKSRLETAYSLGMRFECVPRVGNKMDSIEAARNIFSLCVFDKAKCEKGLEHLDKYRKDWDENLGRFKTFPRQDEHAHGADAFQTFAMGHNFSRRGFSQARGPAPKVKVSGRWGGV